MNTLKNLKFGILAVVLGFGLVVTQSAFKGTTGVDYHYKNSTDSGIAMAANWQPTSEAPVINCTVDTELPCRIFVDGDLQTFLNANPLVSDILNSDELRGTKAAE